MATGRGLPYDAVGIVIVIDVKVSVSPVFIVTDEFSCIDSSNVPLEDNDQNEMSVTTSPLVPAQDGHAGWFDAAITPPDAEPQVTASRVVVLDVLDVPFDPGSPVFSPMYAALVVIVPSAEFAVAVARPSATGHLFRA